MVGSVEFDKEGLTYGILYAEAFIDLETREVERVTWSMQFYSSDKSRRRGIARLKQPGHPLFTFELSFKQLADLGKPVPYIPNEKRREYYPPNGFYDRYLFKR